MFSLLTPERGGGKKGAVAEGNGLVCLAPNGGRNNTNIGGIDGRSGRWWAGTGKADSRYHAYYLHFDTRIRYYPYYASRNNGFSLRLVKDVE